ncbi:arsenic resistance protein [Kitasatospora sp. HPMI-4]|uniref:arsenic resistance protein n=1 Tax=Kitasatospora sp. HPMI-4 TaxID=3448443 RepID=UPI003F1968C5
MSTEAGASAPVAARLSFTDRYLAVWILVAMALGLGLGRLVPGLGDTLAKVTVTGVSLPIALAAGYLTRRLGEKAKGRTWYEAVLLPRIGPFALYGLLFTIVILFALQGEAITSQPWQVARIALPLLVYFALMWAGSLALGRAVGLDYPRATTLAFTAAGNNFELAIAVAIATFGATSGQALAGVVGPLIEVPVLIGLVYVALAARRFFPQPVTGRPAAVPEGPAHV